MGACCAFLCGGVAATPPKQPVGPKVEILITEKLSEDIPSSQKRVYRGRVMPHEQAVELGSDETIGGTLAVALSSIEEAQRDMVSEGSMSVVLTTAKKRDAISDMERESRILQRMQHPNIIRLVVMYQEEAQLTTETETRTKHFMIVEAVKPLGFDLVTYRNMFLQSEKAVPADHIMWLVSQVHEGLQHMHVRNVIHRDLKPDNVVIDHGFNMKIIDFGFASAPDLNPIPMSHAGNGYIAPEVNDRNQPPSIDYWGLGVLVFSMYHNYGKVRNLVPTAQAEIKGFWNGKRLPTKGKCQDEVADSVINLMEGLLNQNADKRWGLAKTKAWQTEMAGVDICTCPSQHVQIYRWRGAVESMFYLTLPRGCPTTTLQQLGLDAMILMVDDPHTSGSSFNSSASVSASVSDHDAVGQGINVLPGARTLLRAGCKIYFAIRDELSDDDIREKVFNKLSAPHVLDRARHGTYATLKQNLVHVGKVTAADVDFHAEPPAFDAFAFPDHCDGANLGPNLCLREKFEIPIAALAREDGSVLWWPKWNDKVQRHDQGLVMRDMYTPEIRRKNAIDMMKVERLWDEKAFRETLGLGLDDPFPWASTQPRAAT